LFGNFARTILIAATATGLASASIVGVTDPGSLGANDFIDWGQLGDAGTAVSSPASVTSNNGLDATASTDDPAGFIRLDQDNGWNGNFSSGDALLNNNSETLFPLTITFASPIFGAGANIQMDNPATFTAQIEAFNGATSLGTFTEDGVSNGNADGSAIFIGLLDDTQEITSITFTLTASSGSNDFAINALQLNGTPAETPEPGTIVLSAMGIAAAGFVARRKRSKA
jgi:PEP-CTERM motif